MKIPFALISFLILLSVGLSGCQKASVDPVAYPIQFKQIRTFSSDVTDLQLIDWNHTGKRQILIGYFGVNEEAPRFRVENWNGRLFDGRLSRKVFQVRNQRQNPTDTIRYQWIETELDSDNDGRFECFLQESTPSAVSLIEFDPDRKNSSSFRETDSSKLLQLSRPESLPAELPWIVTIHGPYPLKKRPNEPIAWISIDYGITNQPGMLILLDSIHPWKERFRYTAHSVPQLVTCFDLNRDGVSEYIVAINPSDQPVSDDDSVNNVASVIALNTTGKRLWQTVVSRHSHKISTQFINGSVPRVAAIEIVSDSSGATQSHLVEMQLGTGKIVVDTVLSGHIMIPDPASKIARNWALLVNETANSIQWLDRNYKPSGKIQYFSGITRVIGKIDNSDPEIPSLYEVVTNDGDNSVYLNRDLELMAIAPFSIFPDEYSYLNCIPNEKRFVTEGVIDGSRRQILKGISGDEFTFVYASKNHFWLIWRYRWLMTIGGGLIVGYFGLFYSLKFYRKRREHRIAELEIRELSRELTGAEERERQRIGRDLHDGVAQELLAIKLNLESLRDAKSSDCSADSTIQKTVDQLHHTIQEVRSISHRLLPAGLDTFGLLISIRSLIDDFRQETHLTVDFESIACEDLEPHGDLAILIYRLVQEALNNIQRHAEATKVRVRMERNFRSVCIVIEDDGKGFEVVQRRIAAVADKRLGLYGMTVRVRQLNGTIQIDSQPNLGTRITVTIPV